MVPVVIVDRSHGTEGKPHEEAEVREERNKESTPVSSNPMVLHDCANKPH